MLLTLLSCIWVNKKSIKVRDKNKALESAVREGTKDEVIELLQMGADVNFKDIYGWTPLMYACWKKRKEMVELLIKRGANVNYNNRSSKSVLAYACIYGNEKIVELLINAGAEINCEDDGGYSPLAQTFVHDKKEIAKLLIRKGADINYRNKNGTSVLIKAAIYRCREIVELLIKKGASIYDKDIYHLIPLLVSIAEEEKWGKSILRLLLYSNNNLNIEVLIFIYRTILELSSSDYLFVSIKRPNLKDFLLENIIKIVNVSNLFTLDNFTFKEESILVYYFLNLIELYKLTSVKEIKDLKKDIIELFIEYYDEKSEQISGYEEKFIYKYRNMENKDNIKNRIRILTLKIHEAKKSFEKEFTNEDLVKKLKEIIERDSLRREN